MFSTSQIALIPSARGGVPFAKMLAGSALLHGVFILCLTLIKANPPVAQTHWVVLSAASTLPISKPKAKSKNAKHPVRKGQKAPPPLMSSQSSDASIEHATSDLQAWWKKQSKSLRSQKQVPSSAIPAPDVLPSSKITNPEVLPPTEVASNAAPLSPAIMMTGVPSADRVFLRHADYFNRVQSKIDQKWVARASSLSGDSPSVIVFFNIRANGTLEAIRVEKSSGNALFDLAALRAVHAANPLPPPPLEMADTIQPVYYRFIVQTEP